MKITKSKKFSKKQIDRNNKIAIFYKGKKRIVFKMNKNTIQKISCRRKFATTKIGKSLDSIKPKHIKEGRLNQIILKYQIGKKKYEVSVIVKNKKSLNKKLKLFSKYYSYESRKNKLRVLSVERYLVKKKK